MLISWPLSFVIYSDPHSHVCHYSGEIKGLTISALVASMSGSLFRTGGYPKAVYTRKDERLNTEFSISINVKLLGKYL